MSQILQDHVDCGEELAFTKRDTKPSQTCDSQTSLPSVPSVHSATTLHFLLSIYWCVHVNTLGPCWLWVIGNHRNYLIFKSMDFSLAGSWSSIITFRNLYLSSHLLSFLLCCFILRQASPIWWLRWSSSAVSSHPAILAIWTGRSHFF